MKLRNVTFISILALALIAMALEFTLSNSIVINGFDELEREHVASDARRVKSEILREVGNLDTFLWDWSSWDDTYDFVQDGNSEFVESNLPVETFLEQSLNAITIADNDGRIVYGRALTSNNDNSDMLLQGLLEAIAAEAMPSIGEGDGVGGLVSLPEGVFLVAKRQILSSGGNGPPMGSMVMARRLSETMIEGIAHRLELAVFVHALNGDLLMTDDYPEVLRSLESGQEVIVPKNSDFVDGFVLLRDIRNSPCLVAKVTVARSISKQGRKIALYNNVLLVLVLIAFSLVVFFLVQRRVLVRMERLNDQLKSVDMLGRVTVEGRDEISEVAHNINVMLAQIADDQNALKKANEELEDKVLERTIELEVANRDLMCLDKAKTHFLSSTSHELRTPLTAILGFIKLMERTFRKHFQPNLGHIEESDRRLYTYLENFKIVRLETERLGRLIDDLLDLNKIEAGRIEWRDSDVDVYSVVQGAVDTISGQVEEKPYVDLIVDVPAGAPTIFVDKDRIHQVLINLLNNAVKFTDKGYVKVVVSMVVDNFMEISVEDTGDGIPEEDCNQVFDIFYQSETEREYSGKPFGTGLGLAICKEIVEHYGGRIWVESEVGKGSSFKFVLPLV